MAFVEWNDAYRTNIEEIDEQHQQLFDLLNELHEAMIRAHSGRVATPFVGEQDTPASALSELGTIQMVLGELLDYTVYHFAEEEQQMLVHDYPRYEQHKAAHEFFVERIRDFQRNFGEGRAVHSADVVTFLATWLQRHVLVADQVLGAFLAEKKSAPA